MRFRKRKRKSKSLVVINNRNMIVFLMMTTASVLTQCSCGRIITTHIRSNCKLSWRSFASLSIGELNRPSYGLSTFVPCPFNSYNKLRNENFKARNKVPFYPASSNTSFSNYARDCEVTKYMEREGLSSSKSFKNENTSKIDPTSLFNADIFRIASRTSSPHGRGKNGHSNFNSVHAAQHAEKMLMQMLSMYRESGKKTARPNTETFRIVVLGYANLGSLRWRVAPATGIHPTTDAKTRNGISPSHDDDNDHDGNNTESAADRMEKVLLEFHKLQQEEVGENYDTFDAGKNKRNQESLSLQVDRKLMNLVLRVYARSAKQHIPIGGMMADENDEAGRRNNQPPWLIPSSQRKKITFAERADRTLQYMRQMNIEPDAQSYAHVIEAWARQQSSASKYTDIVLTENFRANDSTILERSAGPRNHNSYQNSSSVYANRANGYLSKLESIYKKYQNAYCYENNQNSISDSIAKIGFRRDLSIQDIRRLLIWAYSDVLEAWARCAVEDSAKKADALLIQIEELNKDDARDGDEMKIGKTFFARDDDDVHIGPRDMKNNYENSRTLYSFADERNDNFSHLLYPSAQSYTSTILAHSRSRQKGSAKRANELLDKMLALYDTNRWGGKNRPNIVAFNAVISAWANCPLPGSASRAEKVLNQLETLYFDGNRPEYDYLQPDVISYNAAITGWSNSNEVAAVYQVEKLMKRMKDLYFKPINGKYLDVRPDAFTYNACINAWVRSGLGVASAENAENILRDMMATYKEQNKGQDKHKLPSENCLRPNCKNFSVVINAWAKCGERGVGAKRALELLEWMENLYSTSYNSNDPGCDNTDDTSTISTESSNRNDLKPDTITYTTVIDAFARSRLPEGAQMAIRLLDKMEASYFKTRDEDIKPNVRTYTSVMLALVHCREPDKDVKAETILSRMKKMGVQPNSFTYNYAINCCAKSCLYQDDESRKVKAFKIALRAFQNLRQSSSICPDSFTYAFFIKACHNLLPETEKREIIIKQAFRECCERGEMSNEVLTRLVRCVSMEVARDLLGLSKRTNLQRIRLGDLPREWSCNVKSF